MSTIEQKTFKYELIAEGGTQNQKKKKQKNMFNHNQ